MSENFARLFVAGNIRHFILRSLSKKPCHGYAVIVDLRKRHNVYLGASTVYPALARLEKKGYVLSFWDLAHQRPRKVYEITQKGKRELRRQTKLISQILSLSSIATEEIAVIEATA